MSNINYDEDIVPEDMRPKSSPLDASGKPMKMFAVKIRKGENGVIEKAIFIGGHKLDWSVDITKMADAMQMGPDMFKTVQRDVEKHFVESVGEFIGRKVTPQEIKEAIKVGWI